MAGRPFSAPGWAQVPSPTTHLELERDPEAVRFKLDSQSAYTFGR